MTPTANLDSLSRCGPRRYSGDVQEWLVANAPRIRVWSMSVLAWWVVYTLTGAGPWLATTLGIQVHGFLRSGASYGWYFGRLGVAGKVFRRVRDCFKDLC